MSDVDYRLVAATERLAEYESTIAELTELLGHSGSGPDDLRDAIGQIERLLHARDLDISLEGLAEVIRILTIYAHFGAWIMQGITRAPLVGERCPPELLDFFNSIAPSQDLLGSFMRGADEEKAWAYVESFVKLFDRNDPDNLYAEDTP